MRWLRPLLPALYRTYPALRREDYEQMPVGELDVLIDSLGVPDGR